MGEVSLHRDMPFPALHEGAQLVRRNILRSDACGKRCQHRHAETIDCLPHIFAS
jgi:hypothetical protein